MRKRTLMMIGGGIQQVNAVKSAQRCGYQVLVTDRSSSSPCFKMADYTAEIDGRDIESLIAFAALHLREYNIAGVFTLTEMVTSVSAVASALGLPAAPLLSAVSCQNKQLCKERWKQQGVATPVGGMVNSREQAAAMLQELGSELITKPVVGFGGKGVKRVCSNTDLEGYDFDSGGVMAEAFVNGTMHDVNGVFDANGKFVPLGCFDRFFDQGNQVETGATYPSALSTEQIQQAYDLTEHAARALGIQWGPVKSDLVLSDQGFMVLEIAPRLHGPKGSLYLTSLVDEMNHLERILGVIAGEKHALEQLERHSKVAAYEIIDHPGRPFSKFLGVEGVGEQGFSLLQLGNGSMQSGYRDNRDVVGYLFGKGEHAGPLREALLNAKKESRFE